MKTSFVIASVFAAVSGLAGLANSASAGTDIHINVGLGGRPGPVFVAPPPVYGYGYDVRTVPVYRDCPPAAPAGYWRDVPVRVWVPAEWIVTRDRRGCEVRSLRAGFFTYRTDRVWVAEAGSRGGYGYGRG